jgi:hypothetical protein
MSEGKWVRVVLLEEDGLPHFTGNEETKVLVLPEGSGSRPDDPVNEYTDVAEGEEPRWSVQRDFEIRLDDDPLLLEPVAESLALLGGLRDDVRQSHLLYWRLRCYGAIRDALGIPPEKDAVHYVPFGKQARAGLSSPDEVCVTVGQVFGPEAEAEQRRAFGLGPEGASGGGP